MRKTFTEDPSARCPSRPTVMFTCQRKLATAIKRLLVGRSPTLRQSKKSRDDLGQQTVAILSGSTSNLWPLFWSIRQFETIDLHFYELLEQVHTNSKIHTSSKNVLRPSSRIHIYLRANHSQRATSLTSMLSLALPPPSSQLRSSCSPTSTATCPQNGTSSDSPWRSARYGFAES